MTLENKNIDYKLLSNAFEYYKNKGYDQIEVPWIVSPAASLETAKTVNGVYRSNEGEHFVGSAEQGFIELMINEPELLKFDQKYLSISPCFRRDIPSTTYSRWFIKLELFKMIKNDDPRIAMKEFITDTKQFLSTLISDGEIEEVEDTQYATTDLMYHNLELGSYGFRSLSTNNTQWVFGTGLALPRTQLIYL